MTTQQFHKGFRDHFGIKNAGRFLDQLLLQLKKVSLDIIAFDEWLEMEHGNHDNISMKTLVTAKYGKAANDFIERAI